MTILRIKLTYKKLCYSCVLLYITVALCVSLYSLYAPSKTVRKNAEKSFVSKQVPVVQKKIKTEWNVDIVGKAAIGLFLWQHIFEASFETQSRMFSYGESRVGNVTFRFYTGPGVVRLPSDARHVVLILNGRERNKVEVARRWLDQASASQPPPLLGVVLLGNERCDNEWLKSYMASFGGVVKFAFIVYDSPDIDEREFLQWPLGVATYRNFPVFSTAQLGLAGKRRYRCNFVATTYANSSRETLLNTLQEKSIQDVCYVKARTQWEPHESADSFTDYINALRSSDLTLCPAGANVESYRIYEAMSFGSVPVVENVLSSDGGCGPSTSLPSDSVPLRLLKMYGAPLMYVSDWKRDLPMVLQREAAMAPNDIIERRRYVARWYGRFKRKMRNDFVQVVVEKFFVEM